jgi:hypothetical protein
MLDLSGKHHIHHNMLSLGELTKFDLLPTLPVPDGDQSRQFDIGQRWLCMLPTLLRNLHLIVGSILSKNRLPSELLDCVRCERWGSALKTLTIT